MNNKKIDFSDCPIFKTAEVLGGKWSLPIIFSLIKGN
jgi:DNA-binding HxlR family transcriptional regulator